MKQITKIYSGLFCFLFLTGIAGAQNTIISRNGSSARVTSGAGNAKVFQGTKKEKRFTQTYPLRKGQRVEIDNKYGDVIISSWNRREVKADVIISVYAGSERHADEILERINIESNEGEPVSFRTKLSGNISNGKQVVMEIAYKVYLPAENPLSLKNQFGSTHIPDWSGALHIDQSYGNLATGNISNASDLKVSFGSLSAKAISNGNINISYSNLIIDQLKGNINARIDFCGKSKITLQKGIEKLDLKSSYSELTLQLTDALSAVLNIHTNYGDLRNKSGVLINNETKEKKYGPTFNKVFSGKAGSGNSEINISSSFGEVILL